MHERRLKGMILTGMAVVMAAGCAAGPGPAHTLDQRPAPALEGVAGQPGAELAPELDHFIAWIPRDRAATATVAEALAQVEWGNAKEQVGVELCGGAWLMNGDVRGRTGPYPATAPLELGGYPAWYYRISHRPGFRGCNGLPNDALYSQLRANLPSWIVLVRAIPHTTGSAGITAGVLRLH
jgi:hypothetical protein